MHAVGIGNTDRPGASFFLFPPVVTSHMSMVQPHSHGKKQNKGIATRIPILAFDGHAYVSPAPQLLIGFWQTLICSILPEFGHAKNIIDSHGYVVFSEGFSQYNFL